MDIRNKLFTNRKPAPFEAFEFQKVMKRTSHPLKCYSRKNKIKIKSENSNNNVSIDENCEEFLNNTVYIKEELNLDQYCDNNSEKDPLQIDPNDVKSEEGSMSPEFIIKPDNEDNNDEVEEIFSPKKDTMDNNDKIETSDTCLVNSTTGLNCSSSNNTDYSWDYTLRKNVFDDNVLREKHSQISNTTGIIECLKSNCIDNINSSNECSNKFTTSECKVYQCEMCKKNISNTYELSKHNHPYEFYQCNKNLHLQSELDGHVESHSVYLWNGKQRKTYLPRKLKCKICNSSFSTIEKKNNECSEVCEASESTEKHFHFSVKGMIEIFECYHENCIKNTNKSKLNSEPTEHNTIFNINKICEKGILKYTSIKQPIVIHEIKSKIKNKKCKTKFKEQIEFEEFINIQSITENFVNNLCEMELTEQPKLENFVTSKSLDNSLQDYETKNSGNVIKCRGRKKKNDYFMCDKCGKEFSKQYLFNKHLKSHRSLSNICLVCGEKFSCNYTLKNHQQQVHTVESEFRCYFCNIEFIEETEFRKHSADHIENLDQFICEICNLEFESQIRLFEHMMSVHIVELKCTVCQQQYNRKAEQKIHMKRHTNLRTYKCNVCNKLFHFKRSLKTHMLVHTGIKAFKCELCNEEFSLKFNLERHKVVHTGEKPYMCEMCGNTYSQKVHLDEHMAKHTNEQCVINEFDIRERLNKSIDNDKNQVNELNDKNFVCELCGKICITKTTLKCHVMKHSNFKSFTCEKCGEIFLQRVQLNEHILNVHNINKGKQKTKIFQCHICSKEFKLKFSLTNHLYTHTDEKPFDCKICNYKCTTKHNLERHMFRHTGEKQFKCNICQKEFSQKSHLQSHSVIHTGDKPFKCDICDKSFGHYRTLLTHKTIHTGIKPFKCNLCDKDFAVKSTLNIHMRSHTGEKLFKCDICENEYSQRSTLKRHMSAIH